MAKSLPAERASSTDKLAEIALVKCASGAPTGSKNAARREDRLTEVCRLPSRGPFELVGHTDQFN